MATPSSKLVPAATKLPTSLISPTAALCRGSIGVSENNGGGAIAAIERVSKRIPTSPIVVGRNLPGSSHCCSKRRISYLHYGTGPLIERYFRLALRLNAEPLTRKSDDHATDARSFDGSFSDAQAGFHFRTESRSGA